MSPAPGRRSTRTIPTPVGPARAYLHRPGPGIPVRGSLILGHGAGGTGPSADLRALTTLTAQGWLVALVDQPWRVAGRRVAGPPVQLDAAWRDVWRALVGSANRARAAALPGPHIAGGRSAGARVVARTSEELVPDGLLLLSFPLQPPPRASGEARPSRGPELEHMVADLVRRAVPTLLVQGARDPFGDPAQLADALGGPTQLITVGSARGTHSFSGNADDVRRQVGAWLGEHF